jgi:hypothetical protein
MNDVLAAKLGSKAALYLAAIEDFLFDSDDTVPEDSADISTFLSRLWNKVVNLFQQGFDTNELKSTALDAAKDWITNTAAKLLIDWVGPLVLGPAGGAYKVIQLVYQGITFVVKEGKTIACLLKKVFSFFKSFVKESGPDAIAIKVVDLLKVGLRSILKLVAHVLHLDTVKDFVSKLLNKLRELVKEAFRTVVDLLFGKKEVKEKACKLCATGLKQKKTFSGAQNAVRDPLKPGVTDRLGSLGFNVATGTAAIHVLDGKVRISTKFSLGDRHVKGQDRKPRGTKASS